MNLEELTRDTESEESGGSPAWMAPFSDITTLLLTFFVLLLSFANLDVANFRIALGSVRQAFGVQVKVDGAFEGLTTSPVELSDELSTSELEPETAPQLDSQVETVRQYVLLQGLDEKVEVVGTPRGITLRIKNVLLFDTGSDRLKSKAYDVLQLVVDLFGRFDGRLLIEGHTDNRPIRSARFPSNWELSTARSTAVLRYLRAQPGMDVTRVGVAGYAHIRPIAPNDGEADRAKNRRVEFVFEMRFVPPPQSSSAPRGFDVGVLSAGTIPARTEPQH